MNIFKMIVLLLVIEEIVIVFGYVVNCCLFIWIFNDFEKSKFKRKWRIEINFISVDKFFILFFVDFYIRKIYMIFLLCDIFVC